MGSGAEGRLGHADHWDTEFVAGPGAQAGPPVGVQVGVAVDHQQAQTGQAVQDRAQRRQLPQVELPRLVGRDVSDHGDTIASQVGKGRIGGRDGGRSRTPGGQVVHVRRHEHGRARIPVSFHHSRMPDRWRPAIPTNARPRGCHIS